MRERLRRWLGIEKLYIDFPSQGSMNNRILEINQLELRIRAMEEYFKAKGNKIKPLVPVQCSNVVVSHTVGLTSSVSPSRMKNQ